MKFENAEPPKVRPLGATSNPPEEVSLFVETVVHHTHAVLLEGDGLDTTLPLWSAMQTSRPRPLVFIYVDHSYHGVRRDLQGIIEKIPNERFSVHRQEDKTPDDGDRPVVYAPRRAMLH